MKIEASEPKDTVTDFSVYFYNPLDSSVEVGGCQDPDGPGPKQPYVGGVTLKANTYYSVTFMILDETNPLKSVSILNKIQNNGTNYKVCINNPLGFSFTAKDSDGMFPIGLVNDLYTSSITGFDVINFTIRYQKGVKDGQCSAGTDYYTAKIPVTVY